MFLIKKRIGILGARVTSLHDLMLVFSGIPENSFRIWHCFHLPLASKAHGCVYAQDLNVTSAFGGGGEDVGWGWVGGCREAEPPVPTPHCKQGSHLEGLPPCAGLGLYCPSWRKVCLMKCAVKSRTAFWAGIPSPTRFFCLSSSEHKFLHYFS